MHVRSQGEIRYLTEKPRGVEIIPSIHPLMSVGDSLGARDVLSWCLQQGIDSSMPW